MRPKSIVQWEWVYLAVIVLGLASTALGWKDMMATVQVQQMVARFGMGMIWAPIVIGLLVQVLFLYFIGRRGSVVAKWIFVVLTGLAVVWGAFSLATAGLPDAVAGASNGTQLVLQVLAIALLFRADTPAWFGEDLVEDETA